MNQSKQALHAPRSGEGPVSFSGAANVSVWVPHFAYSQRAEACDDFVRLLTLARTPKCGTRQVRAVDAKFSRVGNKLSGVAGNSSGAEAKFSRTAGNVSGERPKLSRADGEFASKAAEFAGTDAKSASKVGRFAGTDAKFASKVGRFAGTEG